MVFRNDWSDAKVSTYYSRYGNFIYLVDTGSTWFWDDGQRDLPVRQWSQANAIFHGIEGEATFHLAKNTSGSWDLRVFGDGVRGRLKDGGNLPRIVPARYGAELRWEDVGWRTSLGAKRYEKQNRVAVNETPTTGYTMVDAHLAYHIDVDNIAWEVFSMVTISPTAMLVFILPSLKTMSCWLVVTILLVCVCSFSGYVLL